MRPFAGILLIAALVSSCGGKQKVTLKPGDSSLTMSNTDLHNYLGYQSFLGRVYPYLQTECASCHTTQIPAFVASSPEDTYRTVKPLVGFPNFSTGKILTYGTSGHCGDNCSSARQQPLSDALSAWWDAEQKAIALGQTSSADGSGGPQPTPTPLPYKFVTSPQTLPPDLHSPFEAGFDLGTIDPSFAGAYVTFNVQLQVDGSILVSDLRFAAGTTPLYVKGIILLVNGVPLPNLNFAAGVNRVIHASSNALLLLESGAFTPQGGTPTMGVAFNELRAASAWQLYGTAQTKFNSDVMPIIHAKCANCHNGTNSTYGTTAKAHMDLSDAVAYPHALERLNEVNVQRSVFPMFKVVDKRCPPPPASYDLSAAEISTILGWAQAEMPQ